MTTGDYKLGGLKWLGRIYVRLDAMRRLTPSGDNYRWNGYASAQATVMDRFYSIRKSIAMDDFMTTIEGEADGN